MSISNKDKYSKSFAEALEIDNSQINDKLKYNAIPEWDSIGHMTLISALEEEFSISVETDDIIDFSSYKKGKKILADKYNIKF